MKGTRDGRAQSNVIGVALLLGLTVLSLGALTAGIGITMDRNAAATDAARVATEFDNALRPVETTGARTGTVSFTDGSLSTADRDVRVLESGRVLHSVPADALVYRTRGQRVAFESGAVVTGTGEIARMTAPPPITATSTSGGVLVVGVAKLNATGGTVGHTGAGSVPLRTNVTHDRLSLGDGSYQVAVETETPAAWVEYFEHLNATVVATDRDFDGDGVDSVVARFDGVRVGYLVIHDMRLEVGRVG